MVILGIEPSNGDRMEYNEILPWLLSIVPNTPLDKEVKHIHNQISLKVAIIYYKLVAAIQCLLLVPQPYWLKHVETICSLHHWHLCHCTMLRDHRRLFIDFCDGGVDVLLHNSSQIGDKWKELNKTRKSDGYTYNYHQVSIVNRLYQPT